MKVKKGDNVIVITGKDKGKQATVLRAFPASNKVILEGLNLKKKAQKSKKKGGKGQIVEKAMPMNASNVMLIDPKTKKRTRAGFEIKDGKKVRIARKSKVTI
jgi:large subunit ribosomal protein L24